MKKLLTCLLAIFLLLTVLPTPAQAQVFKPWNTCTEKVTDSTGAVSEVATLRCVPVIFQNVVTAALMFSGAVALVLIIYSGIKLVTSGGDPKQTEAARKIMTYAVIGVIVILSSFAIIYLIGFITKSTDCITDIENINKGGCK